MDYKNETIEVESKKVSCDGVKISDSKSSGHPLVYLNMGKNDSIICPYCSKNFKLKNAKKK